MFHRFQTKNLNKFKNVLLDNSNSPYILQKVLFNEPKINRISLTNKIGSNFVKKKS